MDLKEFNHELDEEKRKMTNEKFIRERNMNKVIMSGQPDVMHEIQEKVKELSVLFDRNTKLDKKINFQEKTKQESDSQIKELANKLKEFEKKAQSKGLDLADIYNGPDTEEDSTVSKSAQIYDRKKDILESAMEVSKNKTIKKLEELKQKLKDDLKTQNDAVTNIKLRQDQIVEKRKEVNELMLKSKLISDSDAGKLNETADETLGEMPDDIDVENDEMIAKISKILAELHSNSNNDNSSKGSKGKGKIHLISH